MLDRKNSVSAWTPSTAKGPAQPRRPRTSIAQWQAASASAASPAISSAYELVHNGLFTGNQRPQSQPSALAASPAAASPPTVRRGRVPGAQPVPGQHAQQRGRGGGQRAEDALGIVDARGLPDVPRAEDDPVHVAGQVALRRRDRRPRGRARPPASSRASSPPAARPPRPPGRASRARRAWPGRAARRAGSRPRCAGARPGCGGWPAGRTGSAWSSRPSAKITAARRSDAQRAARPRPARAPGPGPAGSRRRPRRGRTGRPCRSASTRATPRAGAARTPRSTCPGCSPAPSRPP